MNNKTKRLWFDQHDRGPVWSHKHCIRCHTMLTRKEVFVETCFHCWEDLHIKDFKRIPTEEYKSQHPGEPPKRKKRRWKRIKQ
jgi:hypothetical protein